jgi:hypothetical protein
LLAEKTTGDVTELKESGEMFVGLLGGWELKVKPFAGPIISVTPPLF